jgi:hypothetical protein
LRAERETQRKRIRGLSERDGVCVCVCDKQVVVNERLLFQGKRATKRPMRAPRGIFERRRRHSRRRRQPAADAPDADARDADARDAADDRCKQNKV